jgi:hypothetical protein
MDQNEDLVCLGEGLGDAFVPVAVSVDENKRPLARGFPLALGGLEDGVGPGVDVAFSGYADEDDLDLD